MSKSSSISGSTNSTAIQLLQKWKLDFSSKTGGRQLVASTSTSTGSSGNLEAPPGYSFNQQVHAGGAGSGDGGGRDPTIADHQHLIVKRAWETALGPLKQLPMNLFIMYMAGNSISIFPIMMVGMMFVRPIKALVTVGSTFKGLEESAGYGLLAQKFIYCLGNLLGLALALYKCSAMGLLPTHESDWLAFAEPPERMEFSGGGAYFE